MLVVILYRNMVLKLFGILFMLKIGFNFCDWFFLVICIYRINIYIRVVKGICRWIINKLIFFGILGIGICIIYKKIDRLS